MKNRLKIFSVVLIAALYLLAANFVNNIPVLQDEQAGSKTDNASFISTASINLFCYSNEKSSKVNNPVVQVVNILKINLNHLAEDPTISNRITKREFARYSLFSVNLLINQKITNLLFPFNFFG